MVQARWGHLNAGLSMLTRLQAWALDAHFALEQAARQAAGYFVNFNGTAGVWRTRCIHEAGGWHSDTLAEDVDLSYRAQLKGWRFLFMSNVEAPAELPATLSALRAQQFRWTKGTAEAARKLLTALWRSKSLPGVKIEGTLHLTSHIVYPALVVVALLHAPLSLLEARGSGPGPVYFAILSLGLCGLLGFFWPNCLRSVLCIRTGTVESGVFPYSWPDPWHWPSAILRRYGKPYAAVSHPLSAHLRRRNTAGPRTTASALRLGPHWKDCWPYIAWPAL